MPFDFLSPTTYQTVPLADGAAGNIQTLQAMAAFVIRDAGKPFARNLALCIVHGISGHDETAQITALFNYAQNCIAYQMHPLTAQWVQDIERTAAVYKSGDCTSKSVALATLLASLGYYSDFRVCNYEPGSSEFSHVFVVVCLSDGRLIPLDPSSPDATPGWQSDCANMSDYKYWQAAKLIGDLEDIDWDSFFSDPPADTSASGGGDSIDWDTVFFGDYNTGVDPNAGTVSNDVQSQFDLGNWLTDLGGGNDLFVSPDRVFEDGSELIYLPDGSSVIYEPDGSQETWDASGNLVGMTSINPDGTITFINPSTGQTNRYNRNGDPLGTPLPATPQQQQKVAQAKQQGPPPSASSSGSGAGIPLGGQKAQGAQPQQSTTQQISSLVKSITDALGLTQPNSQYRPITAINPQTGQPVLINPVTGLPIGASSNQGISLSSSGLNLGGSGSISLTTIAIILVFFFALRK